MHLSAQVIALITFLGGLLVPPITSFLKREHWSAFVKQLIAMLVSAAVVAVAIAVLTPAAFGVGYVQILALVFAASQFFYGLYFKGSLGDFLLTSFTFTSGGAIAPVPPAPSLPVQEAALPPPDPTPKK